MTNLPPAPPAAVSLPPAYGAAVVDQLPGPEWLRARRAAAAERAAGLPFPSTDEEVWRYSRIAELDLEAFTPATGAQPADAAIPAAVAATLATLPARSATVVVVNGRIVSLEADDGIEVGVPADGSAFDQAIGDEPIDLFSALNDALCIDPVVVRVKRGQQVDLPIVVINWSDVAGIATFPRLVVVAEDDSRVNVIDLHASADGVPVLTAPVVELVVARSARLGFVAVQDLSHAAWQIASQVARVEAEATLTSMVAAFGGDYARQRTDCRLVGRGASGELDAIYFGEGNQALDFRTFQDHAAPDTSSSLLFKGAVDGHSHSIYTGLIRVRKDARGTNAFQTNRNIKLSDHAWAESVPNLEIENNEVHCSHASAVGPVDEEQRFYLESRGVPTAIAERLVVTGFFDEVLSRLPVPATGAALRALVAGKLDRRDAGGPA